jgi:hypothetical protein
MMSDHPAAAAFVEDGSGTTLVSGSSPKFEPVMNMSDSDSTSRNGDENDQDDRQFDDIASHMGSETTHDDDIDPDDVDLNDAEPDDILVGLDDSATALRDQVWTGVQATSEHPLSFPPSLFQIQAYDHARDQYPEWPHQDVPFQQPMSVQQPVLLQQESPWERSLPPQQPVASGPVLGQTGIPGAAPSPFSTHASGFNFDDWPYVVGEHTGVDRGPAYGEDSSHWIDPSQPTHSSPPQFPLQDTHEPWSFAPNDPLEVLEGRNPGFAAPSVAMSSAPTALNPLPSIDGHQTDDASPIVCSVCFIEFDAKRRKDMLYVAL